MQRFIVRRFFTLLLTLWLVSMAIFALSRATGDPRGAMLDENASKGQWEELGRFLGLDEPMWKQYTIWVGNMAKGDFGDSFHKRRPVLGLILGRIPNTLLLTGSGLALSMIVGIPLGVLSALKRGTAIDYLLKVFALLGQAAPGFWLAIMMIFFFAVKLDWLPPSGRGDMPKSLILPAVSIGYWSISVYLRLVRSAMLNVMDSEYIKLARAKGSISRPGNLGTRHAERVNRTPHLHRPNTRRSGDRLRHNRDGLRLAWPGPAGLYCHVHCRLSTASRGCYLLHLDIRAFGPFGGRYLRLHRPQDSLHLAGR